MAATDAQDLLNHIQSWAREAYFSLPAGCDEDREWSEINESLELVRKCLKTVTEQRDELLRTAGEVLAEVDMVEAETGQAVAPRSSVEVLRETVHRVTR